MEEELIKKVDNTTFENFIQQHNQFIQNFKEWTDSCLVSWKPYNLNDQGIIQDYHTEKNTDENIFGIIPGSMNITIKKSGVYIFMLSYKFNSIKNVGLKISVNERIIGEIKSIPNNQNVHHYIIKELGSESRLMLNFQSNIDVGGYIYINKIM